MESILCRSKCCKPKGAEKDEGEWMEPLTKKRTKRRVSVTATVKKENDKPRESIRPRLSRDSRVASVRWEDLLSKDEEHDCRHSFDTEALSDPKHDDELYNMVNAEDFHDIARENTLGNIRMSEFGDSFVSRITEVDESEANMDITEVEERTYESSSSSGKRDFIAKQLKDTMDNIAHKLEGDKTPGIDASDASMDNTEETTSDSSSILNQALIAKKFKEKVNDVAQTRGIASTGRKMTRFAQKTSSKFLKREQKAKIPESSKPKPITSIAMLGDGFFLIASRTDKNIKMLKTVDVADGSSVEFVREFKGHNSGVTALVTLDKKGRFLSAGRDLTVRLWDSRFNCKDDPDEEAPEPQILLATFKNPDGRYVRCLGVLNEGSFVRPTDDIDAAMLAAVAKKAAWEGQASAQRAATKREIIECSGTFATVSRNGHNANIWEITSAKDTTENGPLMAHKDVAEVNLAHVLTHESPLQSMASTRDKIVTGDVMGEVFLWEPKRTSMFGSKNWTNTRVFTPWKEKKLHTPQELSKHTVLSLCFLDDESMFVAGSNSGTVRVWDISESKRGDVVYKKKAYSVKVTSEPLSGVGSLPNVKDPNTAEECLAFAVSSTDGHVVSMALHASKSSKKKQNELVIFEVNDYSDKGADDSKTENAIHSIAASGSEYPSASNKNSKAPIIYAGDDSGSIHVSKPVWMS